MANSTIGTATRYRLMPQACITTSSLFLVRTPIVTITPMRTVSGMMKKMNRGVW